MIQIGNSYNFVVPEPVITSNIKYGRLYNWYAVSNALFAPEGWHVPTDAEYTTLGNYLISNEYNYDGTTSGNKIAKSMCDTKYWYTTTNVGTPGNTDFPLFRNKSGLNYVPSGQRTSSFSMIEWFTFLWSSSSMNADFSYSRDIRTDTVNFHSGSNYKYYGFAVRLIKDDSTLIDNLTDLEGNIYRTVKIGNQVWLADNWACTKLNDGTPIPNVTDNTEWAGLVTGAYCNYDNDITNVFIEVPN
jgi:uncharacterized protein (TIGR02145 family)